jgi:hypothetical protein
MQPILNRNKNPAARAVEELGRSLWYHLANCYPEHPEKISHLEANLNVSFFIRLRCLTELGILVCNAFLIFYD